MASVYITSEDLQNCSSQLLALEGEVQTIFSQIRARMNAVSGIWQSPAGNALQEKFACLSPSFDAYCQHLDTYAVFLADTAAAYQENESMLNVAAV